MSNLNVTKKLVLSSLLVAFGTVIGAVFYVPLLGGKMFPIQHFINIVSSIILGPMYAIGNALVISLLRNILGTGSILAFPGSMVGALIAGILYTKYKNIYVAALGEVVGTGFLGAILAYPLASLVLGKEVAFFAYIFPFSLSCIGGSILAIIFLNIPSIKKMINNKKQELSEGENKCIMH